MLLVVVVVVVLLRTVLLFGFRFWFRVAFWVRVRLEVEEDLVLEVQGHRCWVGGVPGVLPRCRGCLCGSRGASSSLVCGCGFGLCRGFVDEDSGRGGSEEEVEDVDEDDKEEGVSIFFDFSFRIMPVNMCRTDLEPGQSLLAPAASCTRCQTPAAELSNLAQDQSSLSPQSEKTTSQPLSVHEIYVLRCFLRSYRPTRRFAVQSFPYRASVPCRNGASCFFHLQQRCWFRHENAQTEAQTQTD